MFAELKLLETNTNYKLLHCKRDIINCKHFNMEFNTTDVLPISVFSCHVVDYCYERQEIIRNRAEKIRIYTANV